MNESETRHLDAANDHWMREERRTGRWSALLHLLPYLVILGLLILAFRVFD